MMTKAKWSFLWISIFLVFPVAAQTGTIKIFSEIQGSFQVYLDEEPRGENVFLLDSVPAGTHYLKILSEKAIVYGELINVTAGTVTHVLIKNTKEVQEKIIQSKHDEIEKYKNNCVEVMLSSRHVTSTEGITTSTYFPGYYSISGTSYSSAESVTHQETDWFVARGGKVKITEWDLAQLAGNDEALLRIRQKQNEIDNKNRKITKHMNIAGAILLGSVLAGLTGLADWLLVDFLSDGLSGGLLAGGLAGGAISAALLNSMHLVSYPDHYLSLEEAIDLANQYNKNLKKSLGIPDYYDVGK